MTEEQKEILIAKMLDAPASLSDEELDTIVNDDELKDIYDMSATVSGACIRQPEPDMAKEWELFRPHIRRYHSQWRWIMRVAGIFIGIGLLSGITKNLIDRMFTPDTPPAIAKVEQTVEKDTSSSHPSEELHLSGCPEDPISKPSDTPHGISSKPSLAKAESTRQIKPITKQQSAHEAAGEIDVEEYLRIQQAKVDNELAMQQSEIQNEIYSSKYQALLRILDTVETDDSGMEVTDTPEFNEQNIIML